jgi:hypothetical protein
VSRKGPERRGEVLGTEEKMNEKIKKRNKKWWDPLLEGRMEGLQEWRVGGGI